MGTTTPEIVAVVAVMKLPPVRPYYPPAVQLNQGKIDACFREMFGCACTCCKHRHSYGEVRTCTAEDMSKLIWYALACYMS